MFYIRPAPGGTLERSNPRVGGLFFYICARYAPYMPHVRLTCGIFVAIARNAPLWAPPPEPEFPYQGMPQQLHRRSKQGSGLERPQGVPWLALQCQRHVLSMLSRSTTLRSRAHPKACQALERLAPAPAAQGKGPRWTIFPEVRDRDGPISEKMLNLGCRQDVAGTPWRHPKLQKI